MSTNVYIDPIARREFFSLFKMVTNMKNNSREEAIERVLLACFENAMQKYYRSGILRFRPQSNTADAQQEVKLRQRLIVRKLGEEWTRLQPIIAGRQVLVENEDVTTAINNVVNCAWSMLNKKVAAEKEVILLPHYGRHFELVTFKYAPFIAVLGVPITSLYSPWDWTMIWHEVAGVYVQSPTAQTLITYLDNQLNANWWHQCLDRFPNETGLLPREESGIPIEEVRRGWLIEFVEDAFGILCLGQPMVDSLEKILTRYYAVNQPDLPEAEWALPEPLAEFASSLTASQQETFKQILNETSPTSGNNGDLRHPPIQLRIDVARQLLSQINGNDLDVPPAVMLARLILAKKGDIIQEHNAPSQIEVLRDGNDELDAWVLIPRLFEWVSQEEVGVETAVKPEDILITNLLELNHDNQADLIREAHENKIRQIINTRLKKHPQPVLNPRQKQTVATILSDLDRSKYDEWNSFYNYELSSVDLGQASYVSEFFSQWQQKWVVTYSFSGVYCPTHSRNMDSSARTSHP